MNDWYGECLFLDLITNTYNLDLVKVNRINISSGLIFTAILISSYLFYDLCFKLKIKRAIALQK